MDPIEIDRISSVKSTKFYKKGDIVSGGKSTRKAGMWSITHDSSSGSISEDIDYFTSAFHAGPMPVTKIDGVESARISLWFNYNSGETLELLIDADELRKIEKLGADLYITSFKS